MNQQALENMDHCFYFRVNEKEYPILSEIAKAIFCLVPSSSPVESTLSTTGNTQKKLRNSLYPTQLENLPEKKIPAVFSPNIGSFFVFFSGNFLIFQEISEIFQKTSWKNSCRY
jgi:hypothetical protein